MDSLSHNTKSKSHMFRRKKPESNAPPGIGGGSRAKQTRAEKQAEAAKVATQPKKKGEVNEMMAVRRWEAVSLRSS